jgi:hypothetical protein
LICLIFPEEVREAVAASMPVVEFDRAPHEDSFNKIQQLLGRRKFSAIDNLCARARELMSTPTIPNADFYTKKPFVTVSYVLKTFLGERPFLFYLLGTGTVSAWFVYNW